MLIAARIPADRSRIGRSTDVPPEKFLPAVVAAKGVLVVARLVEALRSAVIT